jgi:hypothetical protein
MSQYFSLSATATNVIVGTTVTLTASASYDVGPTPSDIWIYDVTTGKELARATSGMTVATTVSQSTEGTHSYVAYISKDEMPPPPASFPPDIQDESSVLSISWSMLALEITGYDIDSGTVGLKATSAVDVTSPSPFFITLFENTAGNGAGSLITETGTGTTLTASAPLPPLTRRTYQAYISTNNSTDPPSNIQHSSNAAIGYYFAFLGV